MTALAVVFAAAAAILAALLARAHARRRAIAYRLDLFEHAHRQLGVGLKIWHLEDPDDPGSLRLLASNPAAAEATGVPLAEVVGKRIDEGFPEVMRYGIAQEFAEVALTGEPKHMGEVIYGDARMTEGIYEVYCAPLPDRSVAVVFHNVTRRKTVELSIERAATLIRMLAEVVVSANESRNAEAALEGCLTHVCRRAGMAIGHVYWRDGDALVSSGVWHLPDTQRYGRLREVTEGTRFGRGEGLPGRVFGSGEPDWTIDATMEGDTTRTAVLRELGLRAAMAFPVTTGGEVVAVLEFFAPRAPIPDEELLNVMRQVGEALGHTLGRLRPVHTPGRR
jgi:hypothetical protein